MRQALTIACLVSAALIGPVLHGVIAQGQERGDVQRPAPSPKQILSLAFSSAALQARAAQIAAERETRPEVRRFAQAAVEFRLGGAGRQDRAAADDVPRLVLRPPDRGRQRGFRSPWPSSRQGKTLRGAQCIPLPHVPRATALALGHPRLGSVLQIAGVSRHTRSFSAPARAGSRGGREAAAARGRPTLVGARNRPHCIQRGRRGENGATSAYRSGTP